MKLTMLLMIFTAISCGDVRSAQHHREQNLVLAPGYGQLEFVPPDAGTYELPVLGMAADAGLIDSKGDEVRLHELLGDKFTLFSFIYTQCSDVNGCPLASHVLSKVQRRVMADDALKDLVRLVSFSFDPGNDRPEVLENYASNFREPGFDWRFVTANSAQELVSTLENYNQFVLREYDASGKQRSAISHILRVYLVDRKRQIRNIYSVSFLHADTILNDIRTIVSETARPNTIVER